MKPIELHLTLTLDEQSTVGFVELLRRAIHGDPESDPQKDAQLKASRNALFAGQKPPEDRGLLIDTNHVAKLLRVSPRTVWRMEHSGEMPKAIRIGKAVRWGYEEIREWVNSGCPSADGWSKKWQEQMGS